MAGRVQPDFPPSPAEQRTTSSGERRRPRPDPHCGNCDGRGCMSCVFREVHDRCEDDCPTCCEPGMYRALVFRLDNGEWAVASRGHTYPFGGWATAFRAAHRDLRNMLCLCPEWDEPAS